MSDNEEEIIEDGDESETAEQHPNSRAKGSWLAPYQFKKGQSGNPSGRPKGMSLKEWAKNYLETLTDEERLEYLEGLNKGTVWKMAEGLPSQHTDVTSGGKPLYLPPELLNKNELTPEPEPDSEGHA